MGIGAADLIDLFHARRIDGEFDDQPVRRCGIDRLAVAVVGLAELLAR